MPCVFAGDWYNGCSERAPQVAAMHRPPGGDTGDVYLRCRLLPVRREVASQPPQGAGHLGDPGRSHRAGGNALAGRPTGAVRGKRCPGRGAVPGLRLLRLRCPKQRQRHGVLRGGSPPGTPAGKRDQGGQAVSGAAGKSDLPQRNAPPDGGGGKKHRRMQHDHRRTAQFPAGVAQERLHPDFRCPAG